MTSKELGALLRRDRERAGYTLRGAARELGISSAMVSQMELGNELFNASAETLIRMADLYGTCEDVYLAMAGKMEKAVFCVLAQHPKEARKLANRLGKEIDE